MKSNVFTCDKQYRVRSKDVDTVTQFLLSELLNEIKCFYL